MTDPASRTLTQLDRDNSTPISGDVPGCAAALKSENRPEIQIRGSPGLIDTLLGHYCGVGQLVRGQSPPGHNNPSAGS